MLTAILTALNPQAILARGFGITYYRGEVVVDAAQVPPGSTITTVLAEGTLQSTVQADPSEDSGFRVPDSGK